MDISVRQAETADYKAVINIMSQVQDMHVSWRPDVYKPNERMFSEETFEDIIKNGTFYVAECDGVVAGILEINFRRMESPAHVTRDILHIHTIAVDENYRRKGIGRRLLDFAKEIKTEKGCDVIDLQVNSLNTAAYEAYKKYGFTEKSVNMELIF